ncbi:MAG: hypothetical protein ACRCVD_08055, partial [Halioglobus sp.]
SLGDYFLQYTAWLFVVAALNFGLYSSRNESFKKAETKFLIKIGLITSTCSIFLSYALSFFTVAIKNDILSIVFLESVGMGVVIIPASYSILAFGTGLALGKLI